jgi:hypothetical protein
VVRHSHGSYPELLTLLDSDESSRIEAAGVVDFIGRHADCSQPNPMTPEERRDRMAMPAEPLR